LYWLTVDGHDRIDRWELEAGEGEVVLDVPRHSMVSDVELSFHMALAGINPL